mmetsp:Transcript_31619/g.104803  ORF Transcript_31619/g.104803 Transcript_31619/m.104803 type:complete len:110 (+) Transcript_31619:92-421(+)
MSMLRAASRFGSAAAARRTAVVAKAPTAPFARTFVTRSLPRLGHNLEDHYDMAEFMCKMHHPLGEYLIWAVMCSGFLVSFAPMMHSNYYFTGRFMPKDQGNTQLCDDSW